MEIQIVQHWELLRLAQGLRHSKVAFIIDPSLDLEETAINGVNDPRTLEKLVAEGKVRCINLDVYAANSKDDHRLMVAKDLAPDAWLSYICVDQTIFAKILDDDATYTSLG